MAYRGPLRDEPVAIELHNTVYAAGGELRDGLADAASAAAFVRAIAPRLTAHGLPGGTGPSPAELVALRAAVRAALGAAVAGELPAPRCPRRDQRRRGAGGVLGVRGRPGRARRAVGRPPRRGPRRRRPRRVRRGRDRPAHRPAARRDPRVRRTRLRAALRPRPPAPPVVLERLRQPRPAGAPLPPHARRRRARRPVGLRRGHHRGRLRRVRAARASGRPRAPGR